MSYYKLLCVPKDAPEEVIRASYKQLILAAHPDKGGTAQLFKRIQDAYDVLRDPTKREAYNKKLMEISTIRKFSKSSYRPTPLPGVKSPVHFPLLDGEAYIFEAAPDRLRCKFRNGDVVMSVSTQHSGCIVGLASNGVYWKRDGETHASLLFTPGGFGGDTDIKLVYRGGGAVPETPRTARSHTPTLSASLNGTARSRTTTLFDLPSTTDTDSQPPPTPPSPSLSSSSRPQTTTATATRTAKSPVPSFASATTPRRKQYTTTHVVTAHCDPSQEVFAVSTPRTATTTSTSSGIRSASSMLPTRFAGTAAAARQKATREKSSENTVGTPSRLPTHRDSSSISRRSGSAAPSHTTSHPPEAMHRLQLLESEKRREIMTAVNGHMRLVFEGIARWRGTKQPADPRAFVPKSANLKVFSSVGKLVTAASGLALRNATTQQLRSGSSNPSSAGGGLTPRTGGANHSVPPAVTPRGVRAGSAAPSSASSNPPVTPRVAIVNMTRLSAAPASAMNAGGIGVMGSSSSGGGVTPRVRPLLSTASTPTPVIIRTPRHTHPVLHLENVSKPAKEDCEKNSPTKDLQSVPEVLEIASPRPMNPTSQAQIHSTSQARDECPSRSVVVDEDKRQAQRNGLENNDVIETPVASRGYRSVSVGASCVLSPRLSLRSKSSDVSRPPVVPC